MAATHVACRRKSVRNAPTRATLGPTNGLANKDHRSPTLRARLHTSPLKEAASTSKSSPSTSKAKNAASVLDDAALKEYRQRMDIINRTMSRREKDDHEVFYGRASVRRNLYDTQEDTPVSKMPKPNIRQKSRSGRAVKQMADDSCLHIAHTLLNVHNTSPHLPYKLVVNGDTPVPFRVKKLLRRVTRAQQKRIVMFRQYSKILKKKQPQPNAQIPHELQALVANREGQISVDAEDNVLIDPGQNEENGYTSDGSVEL